MEGIITIFELEGLTVTLLALNHSKIFSRSELIFSVNLCWLLSLYTKHVPSAKSLGMQLTYDSKSFTNIKNAKSNKGPRVEPYATPKFVFF